MCKQAETESLLVSNQIYEIVGLLVFPICHCVILDAKVNSFIFGLHNSFCEKTIVIFLPVF